MAGQKLEDIFIYKSVSPSSMQQDNILQFSYKSPRGVHDNKPLVLVHEKLSDRFYGINLNYAKGELNEAVTNLETEILKFIEKEYYKKYPDNKKKLNETHQKFTKGLVTEEEYKDFMRGFNKNQLEQFLVKSRDMTACRCYLYERMTAVSRLVFKV